jgi:hypothetical protein
MEEKWVDIKGYNGRYQISNLGNVRRVNHKIKTSHNVKRDIPDKSMKPRPNVDGFYFIILTKGGGHYRHHISQLVAEYFLENPNNHRIVKHKDNNKSNNSVDNLEWIHDSAIQPHCIKVDQFDMSGNLVGTFASIMEAARETHSDGILINKCVNGVKNRKSHNGFIWRKHEEIKI